MDFTAVFSLLARSAVDSLSRSVCQARGVMRPVIVCHGDMCLHRTDQSFLTIPRRWQLSEGQLSLRDLSSCGPEIHSPLQSLCPWSTSALQCPASVLQIEAQFPDLPARLPVARRYVMKKCRTSSPLLGQAVIL